MESGASDLEVCHPGPGRIVLPCGNIEQIETVLGASVDDLGVELRFGGVQFHDRGMPVRDSPVLVLENQGDMKSVSGSPNSSLTIDESLQPFLDGHPTYVKTAQGLLLSLRDLEIAGGSSPFRNDREGPAGQVDLCHSVSSCLGVTNLGQLVTVDI